MYVYIQRGLYARTNKFVAMHTNTKLNQKPTRRALFLRFPFLLRRCHPIPFRNRNENKKKNDE